MKLPISGLHPSPQTALDRGMEFITANALVNYPEAVAFMEERVAAIHAGTADECVWLVEHPPLYTAGTSADPADLLEPCFPVFDTGRGGEYTYHGPGQRVAYVMLNLKKRQQHPDIKKYVCDLEGWVIRSLAHFGVTGERRAGRVGIWVDTSADPSGTPHGGGVAVDRLGKILETECGHPSDTPHGGGAARDGHIKESKIAAVGVRIRHWVTYHGIAINVHPDLSHFGGIVPCGIKEFGVTSLRDLGKHVSMEELDTVLKGEFENVFGFSEETGAA